MTIRIGIAPIGWTNDDLPELGGDISFTQCISEMAEAGFDGTEVGNKFPRCPVRLHRALREYNLSIASQWFSCYFTQDDGRDETIKKFIYQCRFLQAMHAQHIVVCECGNSVQGQDISILEHKVKFTAKQWAALISGLHHLGRIARNYGIRLVYHPHMGTGVQNKQEIDFLMAHTDPNLVSLTYDTGHSYFAGCEPLEYLDRHLDRVGHVHLKDVRKSILRKVLNNQLSFLDAVKEGIFTVPGDGSIDFSPILKKLINNSYQGWLVVEAEQDPKKAEPLQYAKQARKTLFDIIGL